MSRPLSPWPNENGDFISSAASRQRASRLEIPLVRARAQ
jgi:hypothetical protein